MCARNKGEGMNFGGGGEKRWRGSKTFRVQFEICEVRKKCGRVYVDWEEVRKLLRMRLCGLTTRLLSEEKRGKKECVCV